MAGQLDEGMGEGVIVGGVDPVAVGEFVVGDRDAADQFHSPCADGPDETACLALTAKGHMI